MIHFRGNVRLFRRSSYPAGLDPLFDYLTLQSPSFGETIREIDVTVVLRYDDAAVARIIRESVAQQLERYQQANQPGQFTAKLSRKRRILEIVLVADFILTGEYLELSQPDYDMQKRTHQALIHPLRSCKNKFKSSDDFQFDEFIRWFEFSFDGFPRSQKDMQQIVDDRRMRMLQERESKSAWEQLEIDWEMFHPEARKVIPYPRLWSTTDDLAPNGNDTGYDVLLLFKRRKSHHKKDSGRSYYRKIIREWGINEFAEPGDDGYRHKRLVIIGMAFAFLKYFAFCPTWLADEAIRQIVQFKSYIEDVEPEMHSKQELFSLHDLMRSCLEECQRE